MTDTRRFCIAFSVMTIVLSLVDWFWPNTYAATKIEAMQVRFYLAFAVSAVLVALNRSPAEQA